MIRSRRVSFSNRVQRRERTPQRLVRKIANQREGLQEQGRLRFTSVATDLFGFSSLRILRAVVRPEDDAVKPADKRLGVRDKTECQVS